MGECACASEGVEMKASIVCGWRFTEYEELYEAEYEDCDRQLAEEETLCERETEGC